MLRRRSSNEEAPIGEANVLPIMNIMFLLIPALLLAMEVASMASVPISTPNFCACESDPDPDKPLEQPLKLSVMILDDGFRLTYAGQQAGSEYGVGQDSSKPSIPLANPDAPLSHYDRYDYAALEQRALELKLKHPKETVVRVSAENHIPAQVLINTLDALRGSDCKLRGVQADDDVPGECLFFQPEVTAGGI